MSKPVAIAPPLVPVQDDEEHAWACASNRVELLLGLAQAKQAEDSSTSDFWGGVALVVEALRTNVEQMHDEAVLIDNRLYDLEHPTEARARVMRGRKAGAR